jgi:hypothetical protein
MDLENASALAMMVSENFSQYSSETQRAALEGPFHLADECKAELAERVPDLACQNVHTSLSLVKVLVPPRHGFSWPVCPVRPLPREEEQSK